MPPLWLAIDATSHRPSAALAEEGRLLAEASAEAGDGRGGRSLLELVDACFREAGREFRDLGTVVAVNGPGSFTGVRVTLATAMGLVPEAGSGIRLFVISSLAALALQAPREATSIFALVDALRGEWFRQRFERDARGDGRIRPAGEAGRGALEPSVSASAIVLLRGAASAGAVAPGGALVAAPLSGPVAVAASSGRADELLSAELRPLYLRAPAVTPARSPSR